MTQLEETNVPETPSGKEAPQNRVVRRIAAMQMIYERLSGGDSDDDSLQMIYDELREECQRQVDPKEPNSADRVWIAGRLSGVLSHLDELDAKISAHSQNWSLERIAMVDLTILRLAAYEILYENDVPGPVAINEAVELSKQYSEPESGGFVNGVLGAILREKEAQK